jgi:hypothetical protein
MRCDNRVWTTAVISTMLRQPKLGGLGVLCLGTLEKK